MIAIAGYYDTGTTGSSIYDSYGNLFYAPRIYVGSYTTVSDFIAVVVVAPKNWRWYLQFFDYVEYLIPDIAAAVRKVTRHNLRMFSGLERYRRKRRRFIQSLLA